MSTWLLVGASGRVGAMVLRHWQRNPVDGVRVVAQYRAPRGSGVPANAPALHWAPADGPGPLCALAAERGAPAVVIMLAGVVPGAAAPLTDNARLAEAVIDAARQVGTPRVLVASSSAVYGPARHNPLHESARFEATGAYGMAKRRMEDVCQQARATGLDVCVLRIGNVAGADMLLRNARRATPAQPLELDRFSGGGTPERSYIGPATLARVLATLAGQPEPLPPVLNVAAPRPVRMQELVVAAGVPWRHVPAPPDAVERLTLDCGALARLHAFDPSDSQPAAMVAQWQELSVT